jgi:hypothetical protein
MKCFFKRIALSALIAAALLSSSRSIAVSKDGATEPLPVSIISLISSPRQYNNVRVYVIGYLNLSYENRAVYFHEEDFRYGIEMNAIGLMLPKEQEQKFKALSGKHVLVEGTFKILPLGYSGNIANVTRIEQALTEEELIRRPKTLPPNLDGKGRR